MSADLRRLHRRRCGGRQSTCTGASHQLWTRTAVIGGYVTFANVRSGKCLEVAGASTANGAALDQTACTADANQQWMVV
ncbi:RICIN domain-containing protein [Streptomyces sp. NPDC092370]|uniref:RICIN domain-containing protein n=1 Tax=Streptomyces sp. NPDC092370 TaxID=3366016 RepID=UPI003802981E